MAQYEGYASIFYSHFAFPGLDIRLEDVTNHGRIDMTVLFNGRVFIFEFKVVSDRAQGKVGNKTGRGKVSGGRSGGASSKGTALQQIKDRGYADKYPHGRTHPSDWRSLARTAATSLALSGNSMNTATSPRKKLPIGIQSCVNCAKKATITPTSLAMRWIWP